MLKTIKKFITSIFATTYEKSDLQKELLVTRSILTELVIPSLKNLEELVAKKGLTKQNQDALSAFFKNAGLKTSNDIVASISILTSFAQELEDGIPKLERILDSKISDFITDKSMTAREAGIIGTITNVSTIGGYLTDIVMFITYNTNSSDAGSSGFILKRTSKNIVNFKILFNNYNNNFYKTIKEIDSLSSVKVWDVDNFKINAGFRDKKFNLPVNNIILNPIYHIRKLVVDIQIEYYDYLKYKKELIELKLKEKELEDPSPALEKQIKYYEEKLAAIEYKIKKIEESADD